MAQKKRGVEQKEGGREGYGKETHLRAPISQKTIRLS